MTTPQYITVIDEMIEDGRFRYDPEQDQIVLGDADIRRALAGLPLKPKHRRRPALLRDPGYIALRQRMLDARVRGDE